MKKILLVLFLFAGMLSYSQASAQAFSPDSSVVHATVTGIATVNDFIANNTTGPITLKWHVIATDFPKEWLNGSAFGICDNAMCYYNSPDGIHSMPLWNDTTNSGIIFTSNPYSPGPGGDFHLSLDFTGLSNGTHYVSIAITLPLALTDTVTFVINKVATNAVSVITRSSNDVVLYPNPAADELNIVYDANTDVKNIAVYSIIGKMMAVYKVTDNGSANLNLENIPPGVYFVRLANSHGQMVATRKFTKQ